MLFYLTNTLVVSQEDPEFLNVYQAIQNLANKVVSCNHMLAGDFEAIKFFRDIFQADLIVYPLFNELFQNYATEPIPTCLTYYIELVKENPQSRLEGNIEIQQMLYSDFINSDHCIKSQLVCEDLNDGIFFTHVLEWYINKSRNNVSFDLHKVNGGGENTYKAIKNEIKEQHCTICIIDTDKRFPTDIPAANSTYSRCVNLGINSPIYKLLPLQVHELENLIPLNYINAFDVWVNGKPDDVKHKKAFDYLCTDAENVLPFFDYKKGIKNNDSYRNNPNLQNFARHCFSLNQEYTTAHPDYDAYINSLQDKQCIYPCLIGGSGTMTRTINMIETRTTPEPNLLNFQEDNWNEIGQNLLNWCIARNHEAIH